MWGTKNGKSEKISHFLYHGVRKCLPFFGGSIIKITKLHMKAIYLRCMIVEKIKEIFENNCNVCDKIKTQNRKH